MKTLKTILLTALLLCGLNQARALEIAGQTVPDTASVGGAQLVLNGAGKRMMLFFNVYIGALYTTAKTADPDAIITAAAPRRVEMRMLRGVGASMIYKGFISDMKANIGEDGMKKYTAQIAAFSQIFDDVKSVSKGDVVDIDFVPGQGTLITVCGKNYPVIDGDDFASAMLSIWLGKKPAQDSLKQDMLGGD